jgi:hypothetical protein
MAFIRGGYIPGAELHFIPILILKETKGETHIIFLN